MVFQDLREFHGLSIEQPLEGLDTLRRHNCFALRDHKLEVENMLTVSIQKQFVMFPQLMSL